MNSRMKNRIQEVLLKTPRTPPEDGTTDDETTESESNYQKNYLYDVLSSSSTMEKIEENYEAFNAQNTRIFGMPHQFLETADSRIDKYNNFGYCFTKDIFMERPIMTLMPGKPNYLPEYAETDKKTFESLSLEFENENSKSAMKGMIEEYGETRYYDFASDYHTYIRYVNLMCRVASVYLGIDEKLGPDGKTAYRDYNWANYQSFNEYSSKIEDKNILKHQPNIIEATAKALETLGQDIIGERTYVNFFIDPNSSVNETISNSTQASQLEGAFDSMEGIIKEVNMFMNSSSDMAGNATDYLAKAGEKLLEVGNAVSFGLFKNLLGLAEEQVLHGANLIFPEVWMDSEYSKTYSINIKLASPYGTKEAIYLNVLVPMFHALCLTLPRQTSANSYASPFIVRGFANGWFSIDMGMVESIDIDKGPEQSWTVEGLPTQCDITLTIKDFYSQLMMTDSGHPKMFWDNQGLMDYLGVACGVDLSRPNVLFKIDTFRAILGNWKDIPNNIYLKQVDNLKKVLADVTNFFF